MVPPGDVFGDPGVCVMPRFAMETVTELVAVLFAALGSLTAEETVAVPEITVPFATAAPTVTTKVHEPEPPLARAEVAVQVTVPVAPTAGFTQFHPAGFVSDAKVVFVGVTCVHAGVAGDGPLFVTTTV